MPHFPSEFQSVIDFHTENPHIPVPEFDQNGNPTLEKVFSAVKKNLEIKKLLKDAAHEIEM